MIQKPTSSSEAKTEASVRSATATKKLTIFAIPKRFEGHTDVIQSNAISSWAALQPHVEVILFGDRESDPRLREIAEEVGAKVFPLRCSEMGTPLLSDAFQRVQDVGLGETFCYCNCDIIFNEELLDVASSLHAGSLDQFLAIGRRMDTDVQELIDFTSTIEVRGLFERARREGRLASIVCKDFFIYSPNTLKQVPDFRVGRGNWDNWMVANSKTRQVPVIDVSQVLTALHQNHDYSHVTGGRRKAYISGSEARVNQKLSGGRRLIAGSTANWEMSEENIRKRRFPAWRMIKDLPHFMRLLRNLMFLGYFNCCLAFPF